MRTRQTFYSILGVLSFLVWNAHAADPSRLEPPTSGTPRERVQTLWNATRPIILADTKAGLSDAEYLRRRTDVFGPWISLQIAFAAEHLKGPETQAANQVIVSILGLIDKVYGIPYYKEPKRLDIRARAIKKLDQHLVGIDRKVAALPSDKR